MSTKRDYMFFRKSIPLIVLSLFIISISWAQPYNFAPNNGFEKKDSSTTEAKWLEGKFSQGTGKTYQADKIEPLKMTDFIDLEGLSEDSLKKSKQLFEEGKVVVVDSIVGNAARLGNPPGGKGMVQIARDIAFLDAKVIRIAIESQFIGTPIKNILWTGEENLAHGINALETMKDRLLKNKNLSKPIKKAIEKYLAGNNITIMAQSTLLPVLDEGGKLTEDRMRNLGAGELIPTLKRSGADKIINLTDETRVIFSNIDFDVNYLEVVAASIEAGNPDLLQVHVPTQASGGSAYWVTENGKKRIIPLEGIEVPDEILKRAPTLNSNSVVMTGNALKEDFYKDLPVPFEKKNYDGKTYYLPKVSLSDIGKHPDIVSAVAIGPEKDYFFTGSKDLDRLAQEGQGEIDKRISIWNKRVKTNFKSFLQNYSELKATKALNTCLKASIKVFQ